MPDYNKGDFRMNMMCHDLFLDIKDHTANIGANLRPEVARKFTELLVALKGLDEVTTKFLKDEQGQS